MNINKLTSCLVNAVCVTLIFSISSMSSIVLTVFVELPSTNPKDDEIAAERSLCLENFEVNVKPRRDFFFLPIIVVLCVAPAYYS